MIWHLIRKSIWFGISTWYAAAVCRLWIWLMRGYEAEFTPLTPWYSQHILLPTLHISQNSTKSLTDVFGEQQYMINHHFIARLVQQKRGFKFHVNNVSFYWLHLRFSLMAYVKKVLNKPHQLLFNPWPLMGVPLWKRIAV